MALGDGIRRDIARVSEEERNRFLAAILKLDTTLIFPDGVSFWDKQEQIHVNGHEQGLDVHGGAAFIPWHRVLVNKFEDLLREADPELSLHYWDWTTDPRSTVDGRANLFTPAFMGRPDGDAANPGEPLENFETTEPGHTIIWRDVAGSAANADGTPNIPSDADILANDNWIDFRNALTDAHDFTAHSYIGGTISQPHYSFHDPFVFLLHSNLDRLWAMWQTQAGHPERYDPNTAYGADSGDPTLNTAVEPWAGGTGLEPWSTGDRPQDPSTYKSMAVLAPPCYDTLPTSVTIAETENPIDAGTGHGIITFNSVPEGELAIRAAVFRVFGCGDVTFEVTSGPTAPYEVFDESTVTRPHALEPFTEVRLWFSFRGIEGGAGTPAPDGTVEITCTTTGDTFTFDLRGDTIARESVATVLALDQSGSMDDPAGVAGATRIQVLKEAAQHFVSLIPANNGVGVVRFDHDAYPTNDATWPGFAVRRIETDEDLDPDREDAHEAVSNHVVNVDGWTSIGDGVVMARNVLNALPAADYQRRSMLVFTDGIENRDEYIENIMGSIDSRTFAIGLGDAHQVSAAALSALTNNTGGYLLLTGQLSSASQDDRFRLSKYFIQILAGVTNTSIVLDPTGYIQRGVVLRIPFVLNEADLDTTVILLNDPPVVSLRVEAPDGTIFDPASAAAVGGKYGDRGTLRYYKLNLPLPAGGSSVHVGTWYARLEIAGKIASTHGGSAIPNKGALYSVVVQSYSSIKLNARAVQASLEPGSAIGVRAVLTEYDLPVEHRATMFADVERPDGTKTTMAMNETEPGVFEGSIPGSLVGTYHFRVQASGATRRGTPFTREQIVTAPILVHGDGPFPVGTHEPRGDGTAVPEPPDRRPGTTDKDECCKRITWILWVGLFLLLLILLVLLLR